MYGSENYEESKEILFNVKKKRKKLIKKKKRIKNPKSNFQFAKKHLKIVFWDLLNILFLSIVKNPVNSFYLVDFEDFFTSLLRFNTQIIPKILIEIRKSINLEIGNIKVKHFIFLLNF